MTSLWRASHPPVQLPAWKPFNIIGMCCTEIHVISILYFYCVVSCISVTQTPLAKFHQSPMRTLCNPPSSRSCCQHKGWHQCPQSVCRPVRCRASPQLPSGAPPKDPFAEKTVYNDGLIDKLFIKLFTQKMADQLEGVYVPEEAKYDDFVRVSKEIMKGRNTEQQREVVGKVLESLIPEQAPPVFRRIFPASQWSAEINATIASAGFFWLVGESEVRSEPVEVRPGLMREQRSVVHIKKCRYLESSGCVGMCINMCKVPTQDFFTNEFGLPLTMKPDFQTLSCDMVFGQAPPPIDQDEAYTQSCLSQCTLAKGIVPCPKTDTQRERQPSQQQPKAAAPAGSVV